MKHRGEFEKATLVILEGIPTNERTQLHWEVVGAALNVDRIQAQVIRDARDMANKFNTYADNLGMGHAHSPMGYSTLRDLEVNIAKLEVHKEYLTALVSAQFGESAVNRLP